MDKMTDAERLNYLLEKRAWLQSRGMDLTGAKAKEILDLMSSVSSKTSESNERTKE